MYCRLQTKEICSQISEKNIFFLLCNIFYSVLNRTLYFKVHFKSNFFKDMSFKILLLLPQQHRMTRGKTTILKTLRYQRHFKAIHFQFYPIICKNAVITISAHFFGQLTGMQVFLFKYDISEEWQQNNVAGRNSSIIFKKQIDLNDSYHKIMRT